jgi:acetyltransferase-like isoleucine patch superfamily enzyme
MKTNVRDYVVCGVAISVILALASLGALLLVRPFTATLLDEYHVIVDFVAGLFLYGLLSGVALRAMLAVRRIEAGAYGMDSPIFGYWKVLTIVHRFGQAALLPLTPVFARPWVARLFGARIGSNVAIGGAIDDPYLVSIGNDVVLGNNSLVAASAIAKGNIMLAPVSIGNRVTVGVNSVVLPGSELGDDALVVGGSIVLPGTKIPPGETWRGNPARKWVA